MERRRYLSLLLAALWLAVLYGWHRWGLPALAPSVAAFQVSHGVGFALFTVLLLGALARLPATPYPPVWRLLAVTGGAAAAGAQVGLLGLPGVLFFPLWAAALIGVALVSLATRLLPHPLLRFWLNLEKAA
ncbi:MAG: hypothetical protein AB7U30_07865 [Sulfuricellaceae bacterium]|jgi:hypothetical protein